MHRPEVPHELRLQPVGVLVLIHQHMPAARGHLFPDVVVRLKQLQRAQQQIVKVHQAVLPLVAVVLRGEVVQRIHVGDKLRVLRLHHLLQRLIAVAHRREHIVERFLPRKAFLALVIAAVGAEDVDHVGCIRRVQNREALLEADGLRVAPEDGQAEGMKRATADALAAAVEQRRGPRQHLPRSPAGERQQRDLLRPHARFHEVRHTVDERARLACPRPRHNQHRPALRRRRCGLLRV